MILTTTKGDAQPLTGAAADNAMPQKQRTEPCVELLNTNGFHNNSLLETGRTQIDAVQLLKTIGYRQIRQKNHGLIKCSTKKKGTMHVSNRHIRYRFSRLVGKTYK